LRLTDRILRPIRESSSDYLVIVVAAIDGDIATSTEAPG
jgi:hypothetical protein